MIAEAEEHEQEAIASTTAWAEANAARAGGKPTVVVDPEHGPPGTRVSVRGEGFGFAEATVSYGRRRTHAEVAVADGSFQATIRIPMRAQPGAFPITVDDQRGSISEVTFMVTD